MNAKLDTAEHMRVPGLADRLRAPGVWKPSLTQRPWVLAAALLSPLAVVLVVLLVLVLRRHAG